MKDWAASIAIKIARDSKFEPYKHGALIESGGRIVASAVNQIKPHTPQSSFSVHAEMQVLKLIKFLGFRRVNLYVARVSRGGVGMSMPCERCQAEIERSGLIKMVYFTINSSEWGSYIPCSSPQ